MIDAGGSARRWPRCASQGREGTCRRRPRPRVLRLVCETAAHRNRVPAVPAINRRCYVHSGACAHALAPPIECEQDVCVELVIYKYGINILVRGNLLGTKTDKIARVAINACAGCDRTHQDRPTQRSVDTRGRFMSRRPWHRGRCEHLLAVNWTFRGRNGGLSINRRAGLRQILT